MSEGEANPQTSRSLRRKRLARWTIRALYLLVALLLIGWELQEQGDLISSDRCELRSAPESESPLMDPAYKFILAHSTPAVSNQVSVVAIESALAVLQSNVCPARSFTADLIRAIAAQQPAVIAIDKYYGVASCPPGDSGTADLEQAISSLQMPVVVGESTHAPADSKATTCLVLSPQLNLGAKVKRGLTRLNQDVLKLPLRWPVLPSDNSQPAATPAHENSFSLVAATQANAELRKDKDLSSLYKSDQQPYANLTGALERQSSTNLLCSVAPSVATKDGLDCSQPLTKYDLHNKTVVIGSESDSDYPSVLGEGMYGFELQAHYIAALLSGSYLREISPLFLLVLLGVYYIVSELMIPYMHIHRHPRRPLFHISKPLLWTVAVYFLTIALGVVIPLLLHRFPPLAMLLGISGILIPRLLIEGWAILNEDQEDPEGDELA